MLQPGRSFSREAIVKAVLAHGQERGENYRIRWDVAKLGEARVVSDAVPFRAPLLAGGEIEFRPRQGRPAVVVFWASWCKPCIDEAPHLERLYKQRGTEVEFISVSIDEASQIDDLRRVVESLKISYPVALDPGGESVLPKYAHGVGIPLTFVVGTDGTIRYTQRNYQPGDEQTLARAIEELSSGR